MAINMRVATGLATGSLETWAGAVEAWASPAGIRRVDLPEWRPERGASATSGATSGAAATSVAPGADPAAEAHLRRALAELARYFAGEPRAFAVALDPEGTPFLRAAWDEVARVPYGETRSYGEVARALGTPAATRAVGMANATNPLAPFVPCHRVVGSDGRLTGYGPGLPLKRLLLQMEGALPNGPDDYDAWAARLAARAPDRPLFLGVRRARAFCLPECERARRAADLPARFFTSPDDALAAGYAPCPRCRP